MDNFKVTKENSQIRCEICHQADMFVPDIAICLRCIKIDHHSFDNNINDNSADNKNKPYLKPSSLTSASIDLGIAAAIITFCAHLPILGLVVLAPPSYSGIVFFLVEAFIFSFIYRWKREIAIGVFAALCFTSVFGYIFINTSIYVVIYSCLCNKH